MAAEVGFLLIFTNIEAVRFGKDFPVKSADFIARRVGSVLFKFNAESFVRGTVQSRAKAFHYPSCQNLMVGQTG